VTQVYFTSGHGEPGDSDPAGKGYAQFKQLLQSEGYQVDTIVLAGMTQTLKAGDVVVVAGPTRPFRPAEVETLRDFVFNPETKGSLLVMLATAFSFPAETPPDLGLEELWLPWEIRLGNDAVLDPAGQQFLSNPLWALVFNQVDHEGWGFHTITKDLTQTQAAFPLSRSMSLGTPVTTTLTATELVKTGPQAWGETDFASLQAEQPNMDASEQGPLTLGVAAEGGDSAGRLVLYGSAAFASDEILSVPGLVQTYSNFNLALNSVNWLAADEDLISIRPTEPDNRTLKVPENPALLWWFLVLLLPLAVMGIGVYAWWRRR
jgi:ABC-type uncharacterized transport system involved in gliding motility auxiliary subunit